MFKVVKLAIDEYNLYGLLPDAPSNEFDSESRKIAGRILVDNTVEEIALIISDVFSKAFNENFEASGFMKTAEKIYMSIKDNKKRN